MKAIRKNYYLRKGKEWIDEAINKAVNRRKKKDKKFTRAKWEIEAFEDKLEKENK